MIHGVRPAYFYGIGSLLHPVMFLRSDTSAETRVEILSHALDGTDTFLADEMCQEILPRSTDKAKRLKVALDFWLHSFPATRPEDLKEPS